MKPREHFPTRGSTRDAWSDLWAGGTLHSFGGAHPAGVAEMPLHDFWREKFLALTAPLKAIDIATGNGVLAGLLVSTIDHDQVVCDAIDYASIHPSWPPYLNAAGEARLRFLGGVDARAIPFQDQSFDLVISQYGLEYCELPSAFRESLRLLRPGGWLLSVMHHTDSLPVRLARQEMEHIEWLLAPEGPHKYIEPMVEAMSLVSSETGRKELAERQHWHLVRNQFDACVEEMRKKCIDSICPDILHEVLQALPLVFKIGASQGSAAGSAALNRVWLGLEHALSRLRDMLQVAADSREIALRAEFLRKAGCDVRVQEVHQHRALWGWYVECKN